MGFGVSGCGVSVPLNLMVVTRLPNITTGYPETHGFKIAYRVPGFLPSCFKVCYWLPVAEICSNQAQ